MNIPNRFMVDRITGLWGKIVLFKISRKCFEKGVETQPKTRNILALSGSLHFYEVKPLEMTIIPRRSID